MTTADVVALFSAVIAVLFTALLYSEQRRGTGYIKGVKELLELKMDRHDDKNAQQDRHMEAMDVQINKHADTLTNHAMRIHDVEQSCERNHGIG
jgi:hypothetical protein